MTGRGPEIGLLRRRPVHVGNITYIGKESNEIDAVTAGLRRPDEVTLEYGPGLDDAWKSTIVPVLRQIPRRALAEPAGVHPRTIASLRNGHARPHARHRALLLELAGRFARDHLPASQRPADDLAACSLLLAHAGEHGSKGDP